jgi:hypothetical protein
MKKIIVTTLLILTSLYSYPWGPTGHRATGWVAEKYLNKKAKKELMRILNGQSLAMASTWMDEIRSDSTRDYMSDWHWVTIQEGQTYDQSEKNPNGDVIQTLERIIIALRSKKLAPKEEIEYIKILIHLVGDIHQPLHVGGGNDRGGNDIKVSWFRTDNNLHRIWDSDMIDDTHLSYTELGESLEKPDAVKRMLWQKASVRDWAAESMTFRSRIYDYGDGKLGYKYTYNNVDIIRLRLVQAGVRLAGLLNEIYG